MIKITKFKQFIAESKGQLDISIQAANKYLSNDAKKEKFLNTKIEVRHKTDGVKVTLVKKDNTGIAEQDWIVSYKGNIIYSDEHTFIPKTIIKKNSINNAQFTFVWDHLFKLRKTNIPIGTELFVEFLINKPTLSSNYKRKHGMVLIAHTKSTWVEKQGKLITKPSSFDTTKRDIYAKEMKLDVPYLLFEGIMGTQNEFSDGIISKELKSLYRNSDINWDNQDGILSGLSDLFLSVESYYGNLEEGVVLKYMDNSGIILKWQQEYQIDQAARAAIKNKYRGDVAYEDDYWKKVNKSVDDIIDDIAEVELHKALKEVAKKLKTYKVPFTHIKKSNDQILEDIQLTARMLLSKTMPGNQGALFLGKMRIMTTAHWGIIKDATTKYDTVTVALVSSKDTKGTKELRNDVLNACFPEVEVVNASSGNLFTIMNKSHNNINYILAGSDRVDAYEKMLEKNRGMHVVETKRTGEDISASKVIANLDDYEYFKKYTPKCVWPFYEQYREAYKK